MERRICRAWGFWAPLWGALMVLSGCDATVELTKAPFDATSDLIDGISNAGSEFLEPTNRALLEHHTGFRRRYRSGKG